jgi:hypothetical protein
MAPRFFMSKFSIQAGWDDAAHLTEEAKRELEKSIPPYQRKARRNGDPTMGAGAIYSMAEEDFTVPDFPIPAHWFRSYALDVGWNRTAGVWGAEDRDAGVLYLYSEHYMGEAIPAVHAEAIKARDKSAGFRIPGVIDPAARGRQQSDGLQLIQTYRDLGLDLDVAINSVESGIYTVWQRLVAGKLKVFSSLGNLRGEIRMYRRDEKGHIVKAKDHACDAMRYLVMSGLERGAQKPPTQKPYDPFAGAEYGAGSWMS